MKRLTLVDDAYLRELERIEERTKALVDVIEENGSVNPYEALVILGYKERARSLIQRKKVPYTLRA